MSIETSVRIPEWSLGRACPGYTTHSLRHRFATQAFRTCRDITVVQRLLGHSSVATTMRYVALDDEPLRSAVLGVA